MTEGAPPLEALTGFEGQDFTSFLDQRCAAHADRVWMVWTPLDEGEVVWTYAALAEAVKRFSSGLARRGVRPGGRVRVHMNNSPEAIIAWLGCAYGGAVAVTTNTKSTLDELAYFIGADEGGCHGDVVDVAGAEQQHAGSAVLVGQAVELGRPPPRERPMAWAKPPLLRRPPNGGP